MKTIPDLSIYWAEMNPEERYEHWLTVGKSILEHRYRYYELDDSILSDGEYDFLERYYARVSAELGFPDVAADMVGFNLSREDAQAAKLRVDTQTDAYSIWAKGMEPIWNVIGKARKQEKKDKLNKIN